MQTLKFRGRYWNRDGLDAAESQYREGEMIYGGYALLKNSVGNGDYIVDIHGICYLVYPDSVAQLVEVIDGTEIYEGDTFTRDGKTYRATLRAEYEPCDVD